MASECQPSKAVIVFRPRDRFTVAEGQQVLSAIYSEVSALPRDVILDLSSVQDVSSWGFALVCGLARTLSTSGHRLRIAGPTPFVMKYLSMFSGGDSPVEFHNTSEEAAKQAELFRRNRLQ